MWFLLSSSPIVQSVSMVFAAGYCKSTSLTLLGRHCRSCQWTLDCKLCASFCQVLQTIYSHSCNRLCKSTTRPEMQPRSVTRFSFLKHTIAASHELALTQLCISGKDIHGRSKELQASAPAETARRGFTSSLISPPTNKCCSAAEDLQTHALTAR